jgi:hypothetical protein
MKTEAISLVQYILGLLYETNDEEWVVSETWF